MGLVICIAWISISIRSFDYYKLWIFYAKELEKYLLPVETINKGGKFAEGEEVEFQFSFNDAQKSSLKTQTPAIAGITYIIIGVFIAVYFLALYEFNI
ncbi:MAG: hypothetical protein HY779_04210 [Rubrobacteridae bacterium]|nr:hypothetical protein [Rubrobacteridae bacterium]